MWGSNQSLKPLTLIPYILNPVNPKMGAGPNLKLLFLQAGALSWSARRSGRLHLNRAGFPIEGVGFRNLGFRVSWVANRVQGLGSVVVTDS